MNCHKCEYVRSIPGDCHVSCTSGTARVEVNNYGYSQGWAFWPFNFDPIWIESCSGFKSNEKLPVSAGVEAHDHI